MSELMNPRNAGKKLRRHLLTTVSAIALIGLISARNAEASDNDADHSIIWIELGGQLEHITGDGEAFAPPFLAANAAAPVFKPISPSRAQKAPFFFGFGEEGKLALEPEGTDWVFTVAARYGRSNRDEHVTSNPRQPHTNQTMLIQSPSNKAVMLSSISRLAKI